jgi:hypothetical protein
MPYQITGTLKLPDGTPASNVDIEFISQQNYSPLVRDLSNAIRTGNDGHYSINLEHGEYAVRLIYGNANPLYPGKVFVFSDTPTGQDLPSLMQAANFTPATPEYIQQIQGWLADAKKSEEAAASSASAAKISETNSKGSETNAKASEVAVDADRVEVAASKATVLAAQADVTAKAGQASLDAASALSSKNTATAAADTATQKAADAAASEASASASATKAENAANIVVGALIDAGPYNASSGVLPIPVMSGSVKLSSVWKVTVGGTAGGIDLGVGDSLVYTSREDSYYKIDNTESVTSVNGEKGVVNLDAAKVGADPAGTAANLVSQHSAKVGAHPISGVDGLALALSGKEDAGVASSEVSDHEAKVGAHPISGISGMAALIDAISTPIGCSEWDRLRTSIRAGHVPSDGQILNRVDYPDMWAEISAGKVPVVPDADWLADPYKRASFTAGDGSNTFRVPDENGKSAGSIGASFKRGDGLNSAGSYGVIQGDVSRRITGGFAALGADGGVNGLFTKLGIDVAAYAPAGSGRDIIAVTFDTALVTPTGPENRPISVTGCWVV